MGGWGDRGYLRASTMLLYSGFSKQLAATVTVATGEHISLLSDARAEGMLGPRLKTGRIHCAMSVKHVMSFSKVSLPWRCGVVVCRTFQSATMGPRTILTPQSAYFRFNSFCAMHPCDQQEDHVTVIFVAIIHVEHRLCYTANCEVLAMLSGSMGTSRLLVKPCCDYIFFVMG